MESTIGSRLREAIEAMPPEGKERGIRLFQRKIKARKKKLGKRGRDLLGVSYPAINSYLKDETEPTARFLDEAAGILGWSAEYLAHGEGAKTDAVRLANAVAARRQQENDLTAASEDLERAFLEGLPALREAGPACWQAVARLNSQFAIRISGIRKLAHAADREFQALQAGEPTDALRYKSAVQAAQIEIARDTARVVGTMAEAAGVKLEQLPRWQIEQYIELAAHACAMLLVQPHWLSSSQTVVSSSFTVTDKVATNAQ